jgi:hypothetical protein
MLILAIGCILVGAVLGLRFTVWILIPGIAFGLFAAAAAGIAHHDGLGTIGLAMVLIAVGLQLGYLMGTTTRFVIAGARAARARPAYPSPERGGWHRRPPAAVS